ncbi:MAG: cytochrome c [Kangiellaceae bacterium]|nr:cytochrome c [Kangiellaceae bacterium]
MLKPTLLVFGLLVAFSYIGNTLAAGDVAAGKKKAGICIGCHGVAGISMIPTYPNLAGQKAGYTVKQLKAFRDKTRKDMAMSSMSESLTDEDIQNLAAYYASLK